MYSPTAYGALIERFGAENVFVLSAGWGLIRSSFLTPQYDITFSAQADAFKRRRPKDAYVDFRQMENGPDETIVFLGGNDYLPLFCSLTSHLAAERVVFFNSARTPDVPGCRVVKYETTRKTNWHYGCAADLIKGALLP